MPVRKWTTEENKFLMDFAYRKSWAEIARVLERSERACEVHYKKIRDLRIKMGTWKGI